MLKKAILSVGMFACTLGAMGCSWKGYEIVTDSIINTGVIGGTVAAAFGLPSIIAWVQNAIKGLTGQ